ncbi:type II toxin-antitoxin system VapC family toxin [Nostoc sp. UIC 10607]|uniref:type II toxin-antitoxin system VapC family toxin n=1 Tax=Nostoc sp. UIC 10607 TaxID=3045935 RepID=UPI0039A01E55
MTRVLCLDTSVWIPYLVPEVYQPQSRKLVAEALSLSIRLVTPAFAWTEVGSVLRKKTRMGVITTEEALGFFEDFCELPIDYIEQEVIRTRTWKIADKYGMMPPFLLALRVRLRSFGRLMLHWLDNS